MAGSARGLRSLRMGLVVVAVAVVAVLAGYIGYAKHKAQGFLRGLPGHLGVDITQETDHFTYSQSLKGKTVFTVRAAKEIQHANGLITLKDVGIVLYGATGTRADRIHGQEFEYDQANGILRAVGEALIDLGPPGDASADEAHMIHVKTSSLVFRKEDGRAQTQEGVEFTANGLVGQAMGASYDSKTSVLILQSAVRVSGLRGKTGKERPLQLTATRAEMDRAQNTVLLEEPKYVSATDAGAQDVSAEQAVVHTGESGKPKDVEARGRVQLGGEGRGTVYADRLDTTLNEQGQPRESHLYGGVRFVNPSPVRLQQGRAQDVRVSFDEVGRARHALLTGAVQLDQTAGASSRQLNAERVETTIGGGGKEKPMLRSAVASGGDGARLRLVDSKADAARNRTQTSVRADVLTGRFSGAGLTGLDGAGKSYLERLEYGAKGQQLVKETSTGDTLAIDLKPAAAQARKPAAKSTMELSSAVQRGSVEIVREVAARKPGAALEVEHARAAEGDYDAGRDELTLMGNAQVSDEASAVLADKVVLERATGDAEADGAVRVTYAQDKPGTEPVHVLAAHAVAHKASGMTEFTAAAGGKARLWQGGSQVEAAVLDYDRTKKVLVAHGTGPDAVHTTLVGQAPKPDAKPEPPVRILSQQVTYTDAMRQVEFAGRVQVMEDDGTLHAQQAIVFLAPAAAAAKPNAAQGLFGGKVERVVGTGNVDLEQPGRKAFGDKIVYTAADETYVLTGTKAVPPRLTDEGQGTVTGAQLRFKRGDESVEVVGGEGGRVRSEPRVKQ